MRRDQIRFENPITQLDPSDSQIEKWHRSLTSKNLTEQNRPGTAEVRGTRKSTSTTSDRCVGLRIQPRCASASPQPDYSSLSVDAGSGLENKESSAPSARLSWLRIIMREYTQSSSSRAGLGCFVEKKYHVKRLGTSLRGQTRA